MDFYPLVIRSVQVMYEYCLYARAEVKTKDRYFADLHVSS